MNNFKELYRAISIVLAIVIGIYFEYFFIKSYENDYARLRNYAITYVQTLDTNFLKKDVNITSELKDEHIIVNIQQRELALQASYPIELKSSNNKQITITILYEEGEYKEFATLKSKLIFFIFIILTFLIYIYLSFCILYYLFLSIIKIILYILKKIILGITWIINKIQNNSISDRNK